MRLPWPAAVLFVTTLLPIVGNAQVYRFATPPPQTTAAAAPWQIASQPITINGIVYVPTALVRQFDGNVMTEVGVFDGVPVYADVTLEPFSVVYVPVAHGMRTYERPRAGDIAGTTGSQAPMLPVSPVLAPAEERPVGTGGTVTMATAAAPDIPSRSMRTRVESVPQPRATDGVWIQYDGAKWYSDGAAAPYSPERFVQIGSYHGFPVYRERGARRPHDIWVTVVQDGPVAPYAQR